MTNNVEEIASNEIIKTLHQEVQDEIVNLRKHHIVVASLNSEGQIEIKVTPKKPLLN